MNFEIKPLTFRWLDDVLDFFTRKEWLYLTIILTIGLLLRWVGLSDRPIHHDESLHGYYSMLQYYLPEIHYYKYNPLLHGPLLYNLLPYFYELFGVSDWTIRALAAFLGSLIMVSPILFRHQLGKKSTLLLLSFFALSPTLVYWSRFIRHDYLVISSLILCLYGYTNATDKLKAVIIALGLSLIFCTKENSYIIIFFLLFYSSFEFLYLKSFNGDLTDKSLLIKLKGYCQRNKIATLVSLFVFAFVFSIYFSAGFRHPEGILDGLYRKSLGYWIEQHNKERITGPFSFSFFVLAWYEILFILAVFFQMVHFYWYRNWKEKVPLAISFILALVFFVLYQDRDPTKNMVWDFLKIKIPFDFFTFFILLTQGAIATILHLKDGKLRIAFWGFMFFANFFTYSFVGEKVPWLALYPMLLGALYFCFYGRDYFYDHRHFQKISYIRLALLLCLIFNLRIALISNFGRAGHDTEILSQVHTTVEYQKLAEHLSHELDYKIGDKIKVLSLKNNTWPLSWFLHGKSGYYTAKNRGKYPIEEMDYVLTTAGDYDLRRELKETHNYQIMGLRHWWVPKYEEMTLGKFLNYTLNHVPWNKTGKTSITLFTKKSKR